MPVTAKLNYLRIAPRKVRLVVNLIRKKKVEKAQTILSFTTKKAAEPLLKLLKTAIADARHNFQLDSANLYISRITVDEGQKYKRWMPRSRGMAHEIQKKTSHITLVLDEIEKKPKKVRKKEKRKEKKKPSFAPEGKEEAKKLPRVERPKFRPEEEQQPKPKTERGLKRIFRRKAF